MGKSWLRVACLSALVAGLSLHNPKANDCSDFFYGQRQGTVQEEHVWLLLKQAGSSCHEMRHYVDTSKPNALIMYPAVDEAGAYFNHGESLQTIVEAYDVRFFVVSGAFDVLELMYKYNDEDLYHVAGHGSAEAITLGTAACDSVGCEARVDYKLSRDTPGLGHALAQLNPRATIYLDSCLTAQDGVGAANLANHFLALMGPNQVLYAAYGPTSAQRTTLVSAYPFEVITVGKPYAGIADRCHDTTIPLGFSEGVLVEKDDFSVAEHLRIDEALYHEFIYGPGRLPDEDITYTNATHCEVVHSQMSGNREGNR